MPIDYSKYPENWLTEIRPRILARDKNQCKHCGLINYAVIVRGKNGSFRHISYAEWDQIHTKIKYGGHNMTTAIKYFGFTKIVLTVAHLDQDITNNEDQNLASLCQKCHLTHDSNYRKQQKAKQRANNQLKLNL
jgi:hypothetical protein